MVGAQSVEGSALYTGSALRLPWFYMACKSFLASWLSRVCDRMTNASSMQPENLDKVCEA
jgi:hypothetical protein